MLDTRVARAFTILGLAIARNGDQPRSIASGAYVLRHLIAVESWQPDVKQHDVGFQARGHLDSFGAGGCPMNFVPGDL